MPENFCYNLVNLQKKNGVGMNNKLSTLITASGSYIPTRAIKNEAFLNSFFYDHKGQPLAKDNSEIIRKFEEITGIKERRYVTDDLVTSDIGYMAALDALESSLIDKESLDYIIVAHNFGDVKFNERQSDIVPSLASRIKQKLGIENPMTVAYDIPFGCPGWLQGLIQADCFLKSGSGKKALVIGAETLSRISDPHDMDSMIYSDGAGAVILEAVESGEQVGIITHATRTDSLDHARMLTMGKSNKPDLSGTGLYLKMLGHKLYKYALQTVPKLVKKSLDTAGLQLNDIKKIFLHQANEKMDEEIARRLFGLYGIKNLTAKAIFKIMPMTISWLGNSSVATLPTLFDLVVKKKIKGHTVNKGDNIIFASVGAGMNINSLIYRMV